MCQWPLAGASAQKPKYGRAHFGKRHRRQPRITTIARDIHAAVSKAMENVRLDVAGATTDLTNEIEHGGKAVKRTLHAEAMGVRAKFGKVVGNNQLD